MYLCFKTVVTKGVFTLDNTEDVKLEQTTGLSSGSVFPVGETTNTYVATDASGNKVEKSFKITVEDTLAPVVAVNNLTVYLDDSGNAKIDLEDIDNGSSDNCEIDRITSYNVCYTKLLRSIQPAAYSVVGTYCGVLRCKNCAASIG